MTSILPVLTPALHKEGISTSIPCGRIRRWRCLAALIVFVPLLASRVDAQEKPAEVDTSLPGVKYQLFHLQRIPPNRLLVGIRIIATNKVPAEGAFLGLRPKVPANATRDDIASGRFAPKPLSFNSSQMVDLATDLKYPALSPVAVDGKQPLPPDVMGLLLAGQSRAVTLQFALPKVLAGSEGSQQIVSFVFPQAKEPMSGVPIPPANSQAH